MEFRTDIGSFVFPKDYVGVDTIASNVRPDDRIGGVVTGLFPRVIDVQDRGDEMALTLQFAQVGLHTDIAYRNRVVVLMPARKQVHVKRRQ